MKPTREQREKLVALMRQRQIAMGLNSRRLADLAKVDPGQTWRILAGDFRTIGGNLLRICSALSIDAHATAARPAAVGRTGWSKLESSLLRAWDATPQGADRLAAVIDAVAKVGPRRPAGRRGGSSIEAPPKRGGG